jgi:argininosuccinate synthase
VILCVCVCVCKHTQCLFEYYILKFFNSHSVVNLFSKSYLLLSLKGDILEDPANEPKEDMYMMSTSPEAAPDKPE